jgi:hypothetical protein
MVSGSDSEDGGRCSGGPCRRLRHDRGARCNVTGTDGVPGRRPIDQCVALDQHIAVDGRITDHAEPWQRLGQHELPEYVGERRLNAAQAAGLEV